MTNWEWLEALANNSPDELQAWFDSEHVETPNATLLQGDTAALEAKIAELTAERDNLKADNDQLCTLAGAQMRTIDELTAERDKLQEQVDMKDNCIENIMQTLHEAQTRASNLADDLLDANNERDNLRANNEQLHTLAGEQAAKIDELQSALDAICANLSIIVKGEPNVIADIAIETIEELIDECNTAYRHCNEYRNKFGKCIDYADAIHALMDDEGMA